MPDTPKSNPTLFDGPTATSKTSAKSSKTGTSGAGHKKQQLVIQPRFATQITSLPQPLGVPMPVQRGYMIWGQQNGLFKGGELGDGRDIIHFLFNPSTVTADYNVNLTGMQAAMNYMVPGDGGTYMPNPLSQTVSWTLYFDRTYELNYGGNSSAVNDPAVVGVQADIYQFLQFTGVTYANENNLSSIQSAIGNNGLSSEILQTQLGTGYMMMMPAYVFFGNALQQMYDNKNSTNWNAVGSQLSYYGFISEWTVNITHWTANMVPIRASIDITMTMLANPPIKNTIAIWRDNQKMGRAPYTVTPPYAPGYQPPPNIFNV